MINFPSSPIEGQTFTDSLGKRWVFQNSKWYPSYENYSDTFVFTQAVPEAIWTVTHNMGKFPSVTVVDSAGTVVIGGVEYNSENQVTLTFSGAFSGKAYLN